MAASAAVDVLNVVRVARRIMQRRESGQMYCYDFEDETYVYSRLRARLVMRKGACISAQT